MRMCAPHWDQLKDALDGEDLLKLTSSDGQTAVDRLMSRGEEGEVTVENFDPLMSAHNAIVGNAIDQGGLYILMDKPEGGQYCPLCELDRHGGDSKEWIKCAVEEQLADARRLGLAPRIQ